MLHHIALSLLRGLTQPQCVDLLRNIDHPQTLFEDTAAALDTLDQLVPAARTQLLRLFAERGEEALSRAADELEFCRRHSIRPLALGTADYPRRLAECPDAPAVVYYRGTADLDARHIVAVVGTRRITPYGKAHCERCCAELAEALPDTLIVSGLAYGVDIHAHRAALDNRLDTVGVLAHGLDTLYPSSHRDTARDMLLHGGLLTEYVAGVRPFAGNFVRRNRIVAGLADVTLVVESAEKGGALITAHLAADYNRTVCALPGRTDDEYSRGCLHLVRDHRAELVTGADDLMRLMNWETKQDAQPVQLELFDGETPEQSALVKALRTAGSEGETAERLCIITNLPLAQVNATLFDLQIAAAVTLLAGGRYRLRTKAKF
jgi:DNA protecting protein dprA